MNKPTKLLASALVSGSVLLTAACGSSGSGRPSVGDIQKALTSSGSFNLPSGTPSTALTCIAKAIHDSKLSDDALKALVNRDKNFKPSTADQAAEAGMLSSIEACATK